MSFFIRGNKDKVKSGKLKRKGKIYRDKNVKNKKRIKLSRDEEDEEISSEEDDEVVFNRKKVVEESDEEEQMTAQEKKVKLAKEYLKFIEKEELEKLENGEVNNDIIMGRLHDEVLNQAGRLRKKVAERIICNYRCEEFHKLDCRTLKKSVTCLVVSNDNYLYTGAKDCTIIKWSLITMINVGKILPRYENKKNEVLHALPIMCLAVSFDSKYLASCDNSNSIRLWNTTNLTHAFTFNGHTSGVTGLAFCRFTQNLYSCSMDRTIKVWSVNERAYLETLFGHHMAITGIDVLCKNRIVTAGGTDNTVRVWKIQEESHLIYNHTSSTDGVVRLDEHHFITYGDDGSICLWAATKKKPLYVIKEAHGIDQNSKTPYWITAIACISNTEIFASGSYDGHVRIWKCDDNFRSAVQIATVPVFGFVNTLTFTADFKKLIIGVGQEHKLGRWSQIRKAKNSILVVHVREPDEK